MGANLLFLILANLFTNSRVYKMVKELVGVLPIGMNTFKAVLPSMTLWKATFYFHKVEKKTPVGLVGPFAVPMIGLCPFHFG